MIQYQIERAGVGEGGSTGARGRLLVGTIGLPRTGTRTLTRSDAWLMSQPSQVNEGSGTCPVCRRSGIRVVKSTGLLRRHGLHDNPCTGHNLSPVPGSFVSAVSGPTAAPQTLQTSADDTSVDLHPDGPAPRIRWRLLR